MNIIDQRHQLKPVARPGDFVLFSEVDSHFTCKIVSHDSGSRIVFLLVDMASSNAVIEPKETIPEILTYISSIYSNVEVVPHENVDLIIK